MTSTLQIECAKPDCHWKGSPAEAPGHLCPTPADVAEETPEDDDVAARAELDAKLSAAGVTYDPGTSLDGMRELLAFATGSQERPFAEPSIDDEPETRDEIEAWLGEFGDYDDHGIPQDEKTGRLDAKLSGLVAGEPEPALDDEDEPTDDEIDEQTEQIGEADGIAKTGIEVPLGETGLEIEGEAVEEGPRPLEIVIAEALEGQPSVKEYRWVVVWTPADETREAELIGRAKVKSEAVVIQEDIAHRGQLVGPISIHKTADIIAAADKLKTETERRRVLIKPEPDRVVETTPEPGAPDPKPKPEETTPPPKPGETPALFDASDFEREGLAISKVDGHGVDRIALKFSGTVMLDRSNPDHVSLFNRAKIGADLDLWVNATGAGVSTKPNTNRDGDLDVIISERSLRVDTLRILAPGDLEDAGREIALQARDAHEAGEDAAT